MRWDAPPAPSTLPPDTAAGPDTSGADDRAEDGMLLQNHPPLLEIGQTVDRYEVEALIGTGGVASVYRVRHRTLKRLYALKLLRWARTQQQHRLMAEGQIQARLRHPNIVQVLDAFDVNGSPALLMELVEGPSLLTWKEGRTLSYPQIEQLFREIVAAVAHAHAHGIVHRDLKPGNVLMAPLGTSPQLEQWIPRVTDFGIARYLFDQVGPENLTRTGIVLGTPAYMAPEQFRHGASIDYRADLFALGVMLYELCCGVRPFASQDLVKLLNSIVQADYVRPERLRPDLPPPLRAAISVCLRADPAQRIPSCDNLLQVLDGKAIELWSLEEMGLPPASAPLNSGDVTPPVLSPAPAVTPEVRPSNPVHSTFTGRLLGARALIAVCAILVVVGILVQQRLTHLGQERTVATLQVKAWERALTQPSQALALLRAAESLSPPDATEAQPLLSPQTLHRLRGLGAASQVIPVGAQILAVDGSPTAPTIAAGLLGGEVAVWNRLTGEQVFRVPAGVGHMVESVKFSPDGTQLVVVPERGVFGVKTPLPARSLSPQTGQVLYTFAHGDTTTHFQFSPDGRHGITLGYDARVLIWNLENGALLHTLQTFPKATDPCVAISPDSQWLAVGGNSGHVQIFHMQTGIERLAVIQSAQTGRCQLEFAADSQQFTLNWRTGISTWNLAGEQVASQAHEAASILDVSLEAQLLLEELTSSSVLLRAFPGLEPLGPLEIQDATLSAAHFLQGGRRVAARTQGSDLVTFSPGRRSPRMTHRGHTSGIMSFAPVGQNQEERLLSGSRDGTLRLWQTQGSELRHFSPRRFGSPESRMFRVSANGSRLVRVTEKEGLQVWNLDPQKPLAESSMRELGDINALAISHRQDRLAVQASPVGLIISTLRPLERLQTVATEHWLRWLMFSPDDRWVVGWGDHTSLVLVDTASGGGMKRLELPVVPYRAVFGRDGKTLFLGSREGDLMTVDVAQGTLLGNQRVPGFSSGISAMRLLEPFQKGALEALVLTGWNGEALRWDIAQQRVAGTLAGHTDAVIAVETSRDGKSIATASWDRTVRVWKVDAEGNTSASTPQLLGTRVLATLPADPTCLTFSPDGSWLAAAARDGTVWLWALPSGRLVALEQATSSVTTLIPLAEGRGLRIVDASEQITDWSLPPLDQDLDPLTDSGKLTNYRVCRDSYRVVPVIPFPAPETIWAPESACRE